MFEQKRLILCGVELELTMAQSEEEHQKGLSEVRSLGPNEGMVFRFESQTRSGFWMKNTYVPLDIAFFDESGRMIDARSLRPMDENVISPARPYLYAVEMPSGWFDRNAINPLLIIPS